MKKFVRLLFASIISLSAFSANAMYIPVAVGSGNFEGSMYDVYKYVADDAGVIDKSWTDAQDFALGLGGYLTTLTSSGEDSFVTNLVKSTMIDQGEVWAGGYQPDGSVEADGGWTWVNGEGAFAYTNWSPGEPNDLNGEDYLGINWGADQWNDEGALGNIKGFVVETAVPEPSVIALFGLGLLGLGFARRRMRN
jgi:hypothetical protein